MVTRRDIVSIAPGHAATAAPEEGTVIVEEYEKSLRLIRLSDAHPETFDFDPRSTATVGPYVDPFAKMKGEIDRLKSKVATLERAVEALRAVTAEGEVIELRTISREQARREIKALFDSGETLYYSDIAKRLSIDLALVVDICTELQEEGEVEIAANTP